MKKSAQSTSTTRQTLAIFWRFTKVHKFLFWYATIGSVVSAIVGDIIPPLIIAEAFDKLQTLYAHRASITFASMEGYFVLYGIVSIVSIVMWRTQAYCAWRYAILTQKTIMDNIFDHLQHMDSEFHANRFGGALVSQANKFVSAYERFHSDFNWNIINGLTAFFASLIVLFVVNLPYAIVFLCLSLVYVAIVYRQMRKQMPYNRALSDAENDRTAKLADTITNVATVRSFAGEKIESKLFGRQTTDTRSRYLKVMSIQLRNELVSQSGTTIVQIVAFGLGIIGITTLHAPIGALYLTLTYTMSLSERLWQFMFIIRNLNRQFGDAAAMTDILNLSPEIQDPVEPEKLTMARGGVTFTGVDFAYPENKQASLFKDLNIKITPGEKVGLVGPSGGGKTTITQLILRFMDIQSGEIAIDGQDITAIAQTDLRSRVAYVSQEPILFHRTLAENISYGSPEASQQMIEAVAKMAHAHDFILALPQGYQTLVGERGVKLSGGQRQRVAIARAMLKNAPILVLDEATSALDSESEVLIQDALWRLMENHTALVIAHRLSTIQRMDRIIVLEDGVVTEQGSHKDLLRLKGGTYARLWAHQSGGFLED